MSNTLKELATETAWLRRLARSLVEDAAAEDLVHDAYVVAAEDRPADGRPLKPWLVRAMRNLGRMRHRSARRRRAREHAVAELAPAPATPEELVERIEMHQLLARLVLRLDPPVRDVVLLTYGEGLTSQQVGARLGIAAGTVRWRLALALDELRDKLDAKQPKRVWTAALSAFAGIPHRASSVAIKLLIAAAIALLVIAGWIAVQVRDLERDARAGSGIRPALPRTTRTSPPAKREDLGGPTQPPLEAPPPPGRRRLTGKVIDAQRQPVADAEVVVTCGFYPFDGDRGEHETTRTGSGGWFSVLVETTCEASVLARRDGRSARRSRASTDDDEPVELTLIPDVITTLHVRDAATEAPIEAARVSEEFGFAPNPSGPGSSDARGVAKISLFAPPPRSSDGVVSDVVLVVRARGYVPTTVQVASTFADLRKGPLERTVRLDRGVPISGQIIGPGDEPVADAALLVSGPRGRESLPNEDYPEPERSDADGRFEIRVPGAGIYTLDARTSSLEPADQRQGVVQIGDRGGKDVIIRLANKPESGVKGVVVDRRGERVAGARVSSPSGFITPVTTNEHGEFELPGEQRAYHLIARAGDLASEVVRMEGTRAQVLRVTLTLAPAGITGTVVDTEGAPVAGAQLWVNHDSLASFGGGLARRYYTDVHGGFALDVPRGPFVISVRRSADDDFLDQDDVLLMGGTRGARIVLP